MATEQIHSRLIDQQTLNLPHTKDGRIDYRTLGNMISATILGEVVYASAVDFEHSQGETQTELGGWQFFYKESDVVVLRKRLPYTKICCFMGRGVIEAPLDHVASFIHKFHNRLEWDETLLQIEVCQQFSENDWLLYMAHEAKQCLFKSRRDFLYYCRTGYVDGKYVHSVLSIEDKDYPHRPPYIRGELKAGTGWVVEKYNNSECSSLVTYVAHMDLKELPTVIVNRVLRRQPMSIKHMRQRLMRPKVPLSFVSSKPSSSPRFTPKASDHSSAQYEEFTSMADFIPIRDEPDDPYRFQVDALNKKPPETKVKVVIVEDSRNSRTSDELQPRSHSSINTSDSRVRSHSSTYRTGPSAPNTGLAGQRLYTHSLPDIQNAGSSSRASSLEPIPNRLEPIPSEEVPSIELREQTFEEDAELSLKTQEANSNAQEFPAFNSWSGLISVNSTNT